MAYASRTGTRRNLAALRDRGWRLLVSARGAHRSEGFPYALDNGAWTSFQRGEPFDVDAFSRLLASHGDGADWVVAPDIVGGGLASLDLSLSWLPRCTSSCTSVLIAVQDGMVPADVAGIVGGTIGIFVGGSTEWKLASLPMWGAYARDRGVWCHVGRVNSRRRIFQCLAAGATSFDGTSASRYALSLPNLDGARKQTVITW